MRAEHPTSSSASDSRFISFELKPQARLRLICFPHAGAGASMFHPWASLMPADVQVCPVQLPGRENRLMEPPFIRLLPLVQKLARVLLPYLDTPFALFGNSMGALISFELARELRREHGFRPRHLFVSASRAPQLPSQSPPLHQLPTSLFLKELERRYNGIPAAVLQDREMMNLFLPVIRADVEIIETYNYQTETPLECPISAFGGTQDSEVSREDLAAWRDQTSDSFVLRMFPGNHFFLNDAREIVLRAVSEELTCKL